jgi:hypothetical protein
VVNDNLGRFTFRKGTFYYNFLLLLNIWGLLNIVLSVVIARLGAGSTERKHGEYQYMKTIFKFIHKEVGIENVTELPTLCEVLASFIMTGVV